MQKESDEEEEGKEDLDIESFISRHYWNELEEQNDSLFTWLKCDGCGKRRKVTRAHPVLRGLRDKYYCGNGVWKGNYESGEWVASDAKCGKPCSWIGHNVGIIKAKELLDNNICLVEDILFDKNLKGKARTLGVALENQSLKPYLIHKRSSSSDSEGKTPTPLRRSAPYNRPNSRDV